MTIGLLTNTAQTILKVTVYILAGPLLFLNGMPEYGPREPNTLAIVCGLLGSMLWLSVLDSFFGLV